ncbi:MAG: thiamine pyrophosphate-binding protein, partial [Flavobacteriaceae bacterium]
MQKYPSIPLAQTVVRLCDSFSIQRVVICPGSRNAPLTNGFVSHPNFITYSIIDERAAAFFALGMGQQLMQPVALVCTSGSALLNFYPAIAEAFYSDIPLVILSADRMPHSIDIGEGQTIRQKNVFSPHVEAEASLLPDVIHATSTLIANPLQTLVAKSTDQKTIEAIQLKHQQQN